MNEELEGRVAVVTGAGGGIGLACVEALRARGARVVGVDVDVSALRHRADECIAAYTIDMRDPRAGDLLFDAVLEAFGGADILVNNAGAAQLRSGFLETSDDDWLSTLDLNLLGYVRASRAVVGQLVRRSRPGVLVHIASEAARMPNPRLPDYSVSKAAVLMLSKSLAAEFAPHGIRSNVVSPAFIRSPIYDRPGGIADALAEEYGLDAEAALKRYVHENRIPMRRLGTVVEVAAMVVYLASDQASFITGANFAVDGGVTPVV